MTVRGRLLSAVKKIQTSYAIREHVTHGENLHVGPGAIVWAPRRLEIGNDVYLGRNVTIQCDGVIGDQVLFANVSGVVGRDDHDIHQVGTPIRSARWVGDYPEDLSRPVTIGSDVWIGYAATVLSGVTIGDSSIVAAGAVVISDIPPNSVVAGVPARVVRSRFALSEFDRHWESLDALKIRRIAQ